MYKVQRVFHPIGQGAFYSEKHDNFSMVYDCGEWKKSAVSARVVRQAFQHTDSIDILFISHFDFDHVCRIPLLKDSVSKIKCVVMPLLSSQEKIFISNIFRSLDFDILTLINEPEKFFDASTNIVKIKPAEPGYVNNSDKSLDIASIKGSHDLESGTRLFIRSNSINWIYEPWNYEYAARHDDLVKLLKNENIDVDKLKSDPDYTLNMINTKRKKIKVVYDNLEGNINQNSMFVYSGPDGHTKVTESKFYQHKFYPPSWTLKHNEQRVGCIYTGDGDLIKSEIKTIYRHHWDCVGTIQIPHHGDIKSFDPSSLDRGIACPISFGRSNTYGHPSSTLLAGVLAKEAIPLHVTEDPLSAVIQIISCL